MLFGRFVQNVVIICFSDSFVQKTTQQSVGSFNVASDSQLLRKVFKTQPFHFCKNKRKYIVSKESCTARHGAGMCFLPNCRCHIFLSDIDEELLLNLDPLCFTNQHVNCLYKLVNYRLSRNFIVKSGQAINDVLRTVCLFQRNRGVDEKPIIARKRLSRKK